jgi:hypothetical protein
VAVPKFEFRSILTRNVLDPVRHKGSPFTFVHCRDTKEVFFTDAEGNYINFGSILAAVMSGTLPLALPASPVAGPQGPAGKDGATGSQGPIGLTGATGPAGPKADLLIPTDTEIGAALEVLRKQRAQFIAALKQRLADAKSIQGRVAPHASLIRSTVKIIAGNSGISREELE